VVSYQFKGRRFLNWELETDNYCRP
jgi:hypothetical protein